MTAEQRALIDSYLLSHAGPTRNAIQAALEDNSAQAEELALLRRVAQAALRSVPLFEEPGAALREWRAKYGRKADG